MMRFFGGIQSNDMVLLVYVSLSLSVCVCVCACACMCVYIYMYILRLSHPSFSQISFLFLVSLSLSRLFCIPFIQSYLVSLSLSLEYIAIYTTPPPPPTTTTTLFHQTHQYTNTNKYTIYNKQSQTNSGVCCDTRTAVIVVNIISLGFGMLGLITLSPHFAEPDVVERFGLILSALVVGIICNSLALMGSIKFYKTFVMVGLVWYCIESILSLVLFLDFIGAAVGLAFAYPHFFLFKEIRSGIMSKQTYPNEKSCCDCCV